MGLAVGSSTSYTAPNGKSITVEIISVEPYIA
jgi:transcription elongation GreA/GreB family factor